MEKVKDPNDCGCGKPVKKTEKRKVEYKRKTRGRRTPWQNLI